MDSVFISYARQDIEAAKRIGQYLETKGITSFSEKDLSMGIDLASKTTDAIKKCIAVIIIVSKNSLNSVWCRKEWEMAIGEGKTVIPISIGHIEKSKLPHYLQVLTIIQFDSLFKSSTLLEGLLYDYGVKGKSSSLPPRTSSCEFTNMSSPSAREETSSIDEAPSMPNAKFSKKRNRLIWLIIIVLLVIIVPASILTIRRAEEERLYGIAVSEQESQMKTMDSLKMDSLKEIMESNDSLMYELQKQIQKLKQKMEHTNIPNTQHPSNTEASPNSPYAPPSSSPASNHEVEEIHDSIIQQHDSTHSGVSPFNPRNPNSPLNPTDTSSNLSPTGINSPINPNNPNSPLYPSIESRQSSTDIVLLLLLSATTIIMTILFFLSRRKAKQLSTDLRITSDAKIQAKIGENNMLIKKGEELSVQMPQGIQKMDLDYATFNNPKRINCFIAGSTDLQVERDALRATISVVYNKWQKKNFHIFSFTFEDFDRKFAPNGQQPLYDYFIENEADIAVFIIKGDVGNYTIGEFDKAYASYCKNRKPSIVVYSDKSSDLAPSAKTLKTRVETVRQYWIDYETLNELKLDFQEILSADLWTLYEKELLASR